MQAPLFLSLCLFSNALTPSALATQSDKPRAASFFAHSHVRGVSGTSKHRPSWLSLGVSSKGELNRGPASTLEQEVCAQHEPMDYVVLAEKVDCVAKSVIKALHKFASPRRVLIIAPPAACKEADLSFAPNIQCVDENSVLPGKVSKKSTQEWLDAKFGKKVEDMRLGLGGHTMAGWYLQQFLKMGVATAAKKLDLSENYVLWDSDMVLLRNYCPHNAQGQVNLMEGDSGKQNVCNIGYQKSFERLTGMKYAYSKAKKQGFTTHHMVINQKIMNGLLETFAPKDSGKHWSTAILEASCPNLETCSCGFSEYGSYASYMKNLYPNQVAEVPLQYERSSNVADPKISCCPEDYPKYFEEKARQRLLFVSFERSCHKDDNYVQTLPR